MIIDTNELATSAPPGPFDTVIVGAGTLGLFLARQLTAGGHSVAVLESGDRVAGTRSDGHGARSVGKPFDGVTLGRAFGLGGTSTLWGGQLAEFNESDLTLPGRGWPLQYSELRHWYERTYAALGLPTGLTDADFRRRLDAPVADLASVECFYTRWLPQPNLAALYRRELGRSDRVTIFLNATAVALTFDGDRAKSAVATTPRGARLTLRAERFVLAAGTIGNVQFFLSNQREGVPWRDNERIGTYFQEHLYGRVARLDVIDHGRFRRQFENGFALGVKLQPKLRATGALRAEMQTGANGEIEFRSDLTARVADLKHLVRSFRSGISGSTLYRLPRSAWRVGGSLLPVAQRYLKDRRILAFYERGVDLHVQFEQWPIERSAIRVEGREPGANGLLPVAVDWQVDGREIDSIRRFVSACGRYLEDGGLARVSVDPALSAEDGSFLSGARDSYHQCGGMCMSALPREGVTDSSARVWETGNVYVAGACLLPSSSYANCTLTALALGLRLAESLTRNAARS
jgi:choline dehydrogenase-like flavoprotein